DESERNQRVGWAGPGRDGDQSHRRRPRDCLPLHQREEGGDRPRDRERTKGRVERVRPRGGRARWARTPVGEEGQAQVAVAAAGLRRPARRGEEIMAVRKTRYSAADIQVLEGLEPVRKRPAMYIGGTDATGYHHLLREILDNSVDEVINGYAARID